DVCSSDLFRTDHDEVAVAAAGNQLADDLALGIHFRVGLGNRVFALLHGGQIDDLIGHLAVAHAPVRAFDEAVLVDAGIGRQAVDQTDVRAFRRLDRADAAVIGRVHVAHLETGALAGEAARAKRRETALVGYFRRRVGLVHELRELAGAEELAHRGRRRLGVDQVMRHHGVDVHRAHALADRTLHAQQADAVLVLHQLADRPDAAVAEMVDVVDLAAAVLQFGQGADAGKDVLGAQHAHAVIGLEAEARVHLDAADSRQIVTLRIEEQAVEQRLGGIHRRRLARTHDAVDFEQGLLAALVLVRHHGVAAVGADGDVVDVEHRALLEAGSLQRPDPLDVQLLAGLQDHLTGFLRADVDAAMLADHVLRRDEQLLQPLFRQLAGQARRDLRAGLDHDLAGLGVDQVTVDAQAAHALGIVIRAPALLVALVDHLLVEGIEDLFLGQAQREEQRRDRQLAAAVDADMDNVLGIELEVEPRTAIGDHAGGIEIL